MMYKIDKKFTSTMSTRVSSEDAADHLKLLMDDPEFVERVQEKLNTICMDALDEIMEVIRRDYREA